MDPTILPPARNLNANSTHRLTRLEIQKAINDVKRFVESRLEEDLHLTKVRSNKCSPAKPLCGSVLSQITVCKSM